MSFELSLRETVEQYGLLAKKALGQNFLLDQNVTDKIIRLSLEKQGLPDFKGRFVFEVGPGPGGLTRAVLEQYPEKLTVVEMDERCLQIMADLQKQTPVNFDVVHGDALKFDFSSMEKGPRQIVSNLPYHISVPLLTGWLQKIDTFEALTLMFQKEVAERIIAPIKSKAYGRLSVLAQLTTQIDKLMDLNPACFTPAPKIWSTVLLFRPLRESLTVQQLQNVEKLTALAFGQRRKMIRQSLKGLDGLEKACIAANVELTMRAEEISPQQYLKLADFLFKN